MKREQLPAWLMAIAMTTSTASCCLQTVTGIHDNSQGADAGADAGIDAGFDAGIDAGLDSGTVVGPCGPASDMNATVTYFLPIPGGSGDAGLEVTTMASGDLNGDGLLDLVAEVFNPEYQTDEAFHGGFAVFFGEPDGGLSAPVLYDKPYVFSGSAMALADVNGDGRLDLLTGGAPQRGDAQESAVSVFLNDGDGGLLLSGTYPAMSGGLNQSNFAIEFIAAADLNGDGRVDLVLSQLQRALLGVVAILWSNSDGGFDPPVAVEGAASGLLGGIAVGDLNGDHVPDIAALAPDGGIVVLLGRGDGGFEPQQVPYATAVSSLFLLPIIGGPPDLIVDPAAGSDAGYVLQVLDNSQDGSFSVGPSYSGGGEWLAAGDFNGDCIPDVASAGEAGDEYDRSYWVTVLYGSGSGRLTAPQNLNLSGKAPSGIATLGLVAHPHALAVGDADGAGITVYGDASSH